MTKAKLLTLTSRQPDKNDEGNFFNFFYVEYNPNHLDKENFKKSILNIQNKKKQASVNSLKLLVDILEGKREVSDALKELYSSSKVNRIINIRKVCRGCGSEKCLNNINYTEPPTLAIKNISFDEELIDKWRNIFQVNRIAIFYDQNIDLSKDEKILQLNRLLLKLNKNFGISEILSSNEIFDHNEFLNFYFKIQNISRNIIIYQRLNKFKIENNYNTLPLPRLTILNTKFLNGNKKVLKSDVLKENRKIDIFILPKNLSYNNENVLNNDKFFTLKETYDSIEEFDNYLNQKI